MKPQLILLLSLAVASMALTAKAPSGGNAQQQVLAVPSDQETTTPSTNNDADKKVKQQEEQAEDADPSQSYVFDISKRRPADTILTDDRKWSTLVLV